MAERKWYQKLIDIGAAFIDKNDEFWPKAYKACGKAAAKLVDAGAAAIEKYDILVLYIQRLNLIARYSLAKFIHEQRETLGRYRNQILSHGAGALLVAIALVAVYNHFMCYEYSYNGRVMGYVSEQESVLAVLDVASEELSAEYGSDIRIDSDSNISFKRVSGVQKNIDSEDDVLKRFTYMSDVKAAGYAIYVDNVRYAILSSRENARQVLQEVQNNYISESDRTQYSYIGFKEDVEIKEEQVNIVSISGIDQAYEKLMDGGIKEEIYTVKGGDTYYGICEKLGVTMDELRAMNPDLDESSLMPGDEIITTSPSPLLTVITKETTKYTEVVEFETVEKEDDSMYEGDTKTTQEGENGKRIVTARITRENGVETNKEETGSEIIQEPVDEIVIVGTKKITASGNLILPISGYSITYGYGYRWGRLHEGVDIPCPTGTTIRAADGGTVVRAGWYDAYGLCVDIDHGTGLVTRYAHCSSIGVSVGQKVGQGQEIAKVGNTGRSTGSHCHFETRLNGKSVNPMNYL